MNLPGGPAKPGLPSRPGYPLEPGRPGKPSKPRSPGGPREPATPRPTNCTHGINKSFVKIIQTTYHHDQEDQVDQLHQVVL